MKSEDWKLVKRHDVLIYATDLVGVVKCTVTEIDIKVEEQLPTWHYGYPYGKTATEGVVKIKYNLNGVTQENVENLAYLIRFNQAIFAALIRAYQDWQTYKTMSDTYKESFLSLIQTRIAE